MSRLGKYTAGLVVVGCFITSSVNAKSNPKIIIKPHVTRCHHDECSWARIKKKKLIVAGPQGILYKFTYDEGWGPNNDLSNRGRFSSQTRIEWKGDEEGYVFCSPQNPLFYYGGSTEKNKENIHEIDLTLYSGVTEKENSIYSLLCFGNTDYWYNEKIMRRAGYRQHKIPSNQIIIKKPTDFEKYAN